MTPDERALTRLVLEQRWFGSKSRQPTGGRIVDDGRLSPGCALALLEIEFADGGSEIYQLPYREQDGGVVLALSDPPLAAALLEAVRTSAQLETSAGRIEFELAAALPAPSALEPARLIGGEQSNSSIVFGESAILKVYRRLAPGESVELELLRFLAAHGFEHAPRPLGWYRYDGSPITATLGFLQAFVPGARDGWELALESFAEPAPFLARLRRLGQVTARLHTVLASDARDPAFAPEALGPTALAHLGEQFEAEARVLLAGLPPAGAAEPVRARGDEILGRLRALRRLGSAGQAIRQHGDYHLGQVLWADGDWLVLDFEGEPARPLAERRRKSSPLRDVAGMLRSFAYAAEAGRSRGQEPPQRWEDEARAQFLAGYESLIDDTLLPADREARAQVLAAYELDNRQDWAHMPAAGILRLLDGPPA